MPINEERFEMRLLYLWTFDLSFIRIIIAHSLLRHYLTVRSAAATSIKLLNYYLLTYTVCILISDYKKRCVEMSHVTVSSDVMPNEEKPCDDSDMTSCDGLTSHTCTGEI